MRPYTVRRALVVLLPLAVAAGASHAQGQKPGLWETKTTIKNAKMDDAMAKMQGQMANMSPEQRQMVEQMMAQRGLGVAGNAVTAKVCVTKEQAAAGAMPQGDEHCQQKEVSRTASSIKFSYTCTGKDAGSGSGEITFVSPTSWTMHSVSDQTIDGKPEHVEINGTGTWIADDCGSVKPRPTAAR
jgi:hypothetical protein